MCGMCQSHVKILTLFHCKEMPVQKRNEEENKRKNKPNGFQLQFLVFIRNGTFVDTLNYEVLGNASCFIVQLIYLRLLHGEGYQQTFSGKLLLSTNTANT